MIKKYFLFTTIFLILTSCGYKPIFSSKTLNFTIENIDRNNTPLNSEIVKVIKNFTNKNGEKKINLEIESNKDVTVKSKDTKGNALVYELRINLKVTVFDIDREKLFIKKTTYKNSDDKFKLKQYEGELEKILINNIVEDLIEYLSNVL